MRFLLHAAAGLVALIFGPATINLRDSGESVSSPGRPLLQNVCKHVKNIL